ncbi:GFA family protein [Roseovarius faecimaris]|uniref:GFA family protein n=1 Tax=Roseovarius faecimaris TaxID=2494550 RepID=A0A6I6IQC8_9RHOB|nr:GFA family protein [Roseovarius faecimaris]QGX98043.1 GFA family protein [Roseovarius faecimaris]
MTDIRHAACACGALGLSCRGTPALVSLCHCTQCQKRSGGPFGIAAFYPAEAVEIAGQSTRFTRESDHGHPVDFHFCPVCGSTVFWYPRRKPGMIAVATGAFADPAFPAPTQEVFTEHRHLWVRPLA